MFDNQNAPKSAIEQFLEAIGQKGLTPPKTIIADGRRHYFSSNGKPNDGAGWYSFHNDIIATGSFGDFRSGRGMSVWTADIGRELSPDEQQDFRKRQQELRIKNDDDTAQRRDKAKAKAVGMLKHSKPAPNYHPYLRRKGVQSHKLRLWKDNLLLVPMYDNSGEVQSLQIISPNGDKKFLAGGRMQGCYYTLGSLKDADMILVAEGYATAATIHEVTGHPVVVAYNAGNLSAVSKSIRAQYPDTPMYICADDDIKTKGNPGITKATEAAHAVEAKIIAPDFGANRPDGVTDFNDMAALSGKDAVTRFFTERFSETMANDYSEGDADDPDDRASEQRVYFSTPTEQHFVPPSAPYAEQSERESAGASHHPAYPRAAARPLPEPIAKPKCHFSGNEFAVVHHIWKDVPRQVSRHDESGYHHIVDEKRKVIVSKDVIELARKPRHRPDEAYAAACEHARHFWDGQMEVHGDSTHCIKAWAYATASGIQVTNYSPTDRELIEAEKIVAKLRKKMEPTFRRPSSYRPINGAKPRP